MSRPAQPPPARTAPAAKPASATVYVLNDTRPPATPGSLLAPYLGLVSAVGCALVGGWLLLAPYDLDYRNGAARLPADSLIDLGAGAVAVGCGLITAALFLRVLFKSTQYRVTRLDPAGEGVADAPRTGSAPAPDPVAAAESESGRPPAPDPRAADVTAPQAGSMDALRDLLTPLVAALAADLRSREADGARGWRVPGQKRQD